jgi:hypothetical protein
MDDAIHRQEVDGEPYERPLPPEHLLIEARAHDYRRRVYQWIREREMAESNNPAEPEAVIAWFHTLISAKIHRALHGLAGDSPEDREWPADYDGSAKVALLGIERSHAAWRALADRDALTEADAARFMTDLAWLSEALERVFPKARAFVRPGFDEPDEVARLRAREQRPWRSAS